MAEYNELAVSGFHLRLPILCSIICVISLKIASDHRTLMKLSTFQIGKAEANLEVSETGLFALIYHIVKFRLCERGKGTVGVKFAIYIKLFLKFLLQIILK